MLDRKAILAKVAALGWAPADYWLVAGAAMVLRGAKDLTRDIDMGVSTALADRLIDRGAAWKRGADGRRLIALSGGIELFENWRAGEIGLIDGVPALSLDGIAEQKQQLGREKDARDIALIRAHQNPRATRVYFVRHAQPNFDNHDDLTRELNAKGLADRRLVTDYLKDKGITAVLSSPYKRAVDTVRPLAGARGMEIELVDGFRERRVDHGWIADIDAFTRSQWADFSYRRAGGESLGEVRARNVAALNDVLARHAGGTIAVGAHGTALSALINHFDPSFGYEQFMEIRSLMPWIQKFTFVGTACAGMEKIDLFDLQEDLA